jgi:hypothetical protein
MNAAGDPPLSPEPKRPRYKWPWFLLGATGLAVLLAIVWMSREVERMRRIRELNYPGTNHVTPSRSP